MADQKKLPLRKGVYILPNLLTSASLFAAVLAIIWASQARFEAAALAILFAALMDGLDGKVARLTNTSSEFGVQYDSLADLVAFGVAPGFLMYNWEIGGFGRVALVVTFLYVTCGALRLARFNISGASGSKKFFTGLPIPAAGCTICTLILFAPFVPAGLWPVMPYLCLALTFFLAVAMVSRVRYYAFKEFGFFKAHRFSSMVTAMLLFACIAAQPRILGFVIMIGYFFSGPIYTFMFMSRKLGHIAETPKTAQARASGPKPNNSEKSA